MSFWLLLQVFLNLIFGVTIFILWARLSRSPKEDPRLSKGLQVLQTKISILEDLSDRTDKQVQDLCTIIERKSKEVEVAIIQSEEQIAKINLSMKKSIEVAEIFEDKIPHDEIVERKNSKKYIEAALLAHRGLKPEEIAAKVDLSIAEIELISKVNKDRLMFAEEDLPTWAKKDVERDFSEVFNEKHYEEFKDLGNKFRSASVGPADSNQQAVPVEEKTSPIQTNQQALDIIS